MAGQIETRLAELGIILPEPTTPAAAYVPFVQSGNLLFMSGQVPFGMDPLPLGTLTAEDHVDGDPAPGSKFALAQAAARQCGINLISQMKAATGDLDRVKRVVKLLGFVNSEASFRQHPLIVNGASNLMGEVFGSAGEHARAAVGSSALPLGVLVEVEAIVELQD